jgi:hypothetical protein
MASMNPNDLSKKSITELILRMEILDAEICKISRTEIHKKSEAEIRKIYRTISRAVQQIGPPKCGCKCVEFCYRYKHNQEYIDTLDTKEQILYAVKSNPCLLKNLKYNTKFKKDEEIVLAAVESNGHALKYISKYMRNSYKDVVLVAVKQNGMALKYTKLKNKKEIVLTAVAQNGMALEYASKYLKNLKQLVMIAIAQNYKALQFASVECRDDNDIVLFAITNNIEALQYASERCRRDPYIMFISLNYNLSNNIYKNMKLNYEYLLIAIISNRHLLNSLSIVDRELFITRTNQLKNTHTEYKYYILLGRLEHNKDNLICKMNNFSIEFVSYFDRQILGYLGIPNNYGWEFPNGHFWKYIQKFK